MPLRAGLSALFIALAATLFLPVTSAQSNPVDMIRPIFDQVVWVSIVIGVFVEGLLMYALIRFRRRKDSPAEAPQIHGNNKLEIAWTVAPALVMAWLLVISASALQEIHDAPEPDFTVLVIGHQWAWTFEYPDGTSTTDGVLRVEQGRTVGLIVTSTDVIHAFRVPEFGVMIDALPGRETTAWFVAESEGIYNAQCFQFCGREHGKMNASVEVFAAGTQAVPWGLAPVEPPTVDNGTAGSSQPPEAGNQTPPAAVVADQVVDMELKGFRFVYSGAPEPLHFEPNTTVEFRLSNQDGSLHNMYIGTFAGELADRMPAFNSSDVPPQSQSSFIVAFGAEDVAFDIWCNIQGHASADPASMRANLLVGEPTLVAPTDLGPQPLLPGPGLAALAIAFLLGLVVAARGRRS